MDLLEFLNLHARYGRISTRRATKVISMTATCPLCGTPAEETTTGNPASPTYILACEVCETFSITYRALDQVRRGLLPFGPIRGWIYDQHRMGAPAAITSGV